MRRTHKAAAAITAALLAAAGLAATAPRAVAQPPGQSGPPAGVLAFTPGGLGTSFTVPNPDGAFAAVVEVGLLNNTDSDMTVWTPALDVTPDNMQDFQTGGGVQEATVAPGATWTDTVVVVGPTEATVTALVGNNASVTWTINAEALSNPPSPSPPQLPGLGSLSGSSLYQAEDAEPSLVGPSPLATVPFNIGANDARDLVSEASVPAGVSGTAGTVDLSLTLPQTASLDGWKPDQTQVVDASWTGEVGTSETTWTKVVVATPFLQTTAPAIPAELSVTTKPGTTSPVKFTTAPGADVSATSVVLAGADAADFSVTLDEAAKASPTDGGLWRPVDVGLLTTKPGTYHAEVIVKLDPAGTVFYAEVPVTGTVPATSTSTGTSTSTTTTTTPTPTQFHFTPPPPDPVAVGQTCGAGGTQVQIWGQNLAGSTVRFAGIESAPVRVLGPGEVQTTVPHGVRRDGRIVVVGPGGQAVPVPGWPRWHVACPTALSVGLRRVGGLVEATATLDSGNTPVVGGRVVLLRNGEQVGSLLTGPHGHAGAVFLPDNTPTEAVFDGASHLRASEWRAGR